MHKSSPNTEYFAEVQAWDNSRVDVLIKVGSFFEAVEAKTKPCLQLLYQALNWTTSTNRITIVTYPPAGKKTNHAFADLCKRLNINWFVYSSSTKTFIRRAQASDINITSDFSPLWKKYILEGHSNLESAGTTGEFWTTFKQTRQRLIEVVQKEPGITLRQAVKSISHHYKNDSIAESSLYKYILNNTIKEIIEVPKNSKRLYVK